MPKGIDSVEKLVAFFKEKGQVCIPLRIVDIFELSPKHQSKLLKFTGLSKHGSDPKKVFMRHSFGGYHLLNIETLASNVRDIKDLEPFQEIISSYNNVRMGKGVTAREEDCECKRKGCKKCMGAGSVTVLEELSPEEKRMATEGK